ncbi:tyrosine-type recombinase/integrase [Sphingorhabdus sp.]|jgi:integrase|uniref:tyrosine-type recombinase/integrase n=1 Tax=Sphingorhabdus sp. TaxID=1902408 RepID=UPI0037C7DD9E
MPRANLSTHFILSAVCPDNKSKIEYIDTNLEGFFVEVHRSGTKTFYQRYIDGHHRQRQMKIGRANVLTLADARKRAIQIKADVFLGKDPKQPKNELRKIPTLKEFVVERYLPYVQQNKRSWKTDETVIRLHLLPAMGKFYLDEITAQMVVKMMTDMRAEGYANGTCNRPVIFLRYMLNLASDWGIPNLERNPAKKVQLFEETQRQRFLSPFEMRALMNALKSDENVQAAKAIELLLLTGARRNEITQARWEHMNLEQNTMLVPLSKSGKPRTISLNKAACYLISRLPSRAESPWLFPSPTTGRPSPALYYPWARVRKRAGLTDLRLHDLRHSYASNLVNGGVSLYVVQQLLGHTNPGTTQRYAHLEQGTLAKAAEVAAETLKSAVDKR